jgi:beta-lactamase class A
LFVGARERSSFDALQSQIATIQQSSGARIGVSLIELGGVQPKSWSSNGDQQFEAASTYKLAVLMAEGQIIAANPAAANDPLCYQDQDWEDGWFQDYADGVCYSRASLSYRVGKYSDNTAGHILVRYLGGTAALNNYARQHGASGSGLYVPNVTSPNDLARLMANEARGGAGGAAAQAWLYPLLTNTAFETGLPAGVASNATVVHKIGVIDTVSNDIGLISGSLNGPYVLAVCTDGPGGDQGMAIVAQVSAAVWQYESSPAR